MVVLSWDELEKLSEEARVYWDYGPWFAVALTRTHKESYVVPFHYNDDPKIEALVTPEVVKAALDMDIIAIEWLDRYLKSCLPNRLKDTGLNPVIEVEDV